MSIRISKLEIENVKRVKAVTIEPTAAGLTIVGGRNNQGKTSVLDAISWGLGGEKYRPSEPRRDGSVVPPSLRIELSNGLVVERKGKNSDLKVIDPSGNKAGQQLLNEFVSQFALNLPKFMEATSKEKASTLLQIIGIGEQLFALEKQETELYNRRKAIGQIADQKKKYAAELIDYADAPTEPIAASELIRQQQDILSRNGENQRKRENIKAIQSQLDLITNKIEDLKTQLYDLGKKEETLVNDLEAANKSAIDLHDESTEELERNIENIEEINRKVRANQDKEKAEDEAREYSKQYSDITIQIENARKAKTDLLEGANLPLEGLSVVDGELTYKGYKWDNMSGSDQLKVSAAIVRKLNPECGFVLMDKLEQMDMETLKEFGEWLETEELQAIATRVSTGDECSIIIEDGYSSGKVEIPQKEEPKWKVGEF